MPVTTLKTRQNILQRAIERLKNLETALAGVDVDTHEESLSGPFERRSMENITLMNHVGRTP